MVNRLPHWWTGLGGATGIWLFVGFWLNPRSAITTDGAPAPQYCVINSVRWAH